MRLSTDLVARFQKRYFEAFAEYISPEAAEAELIGLAELIRITSRPKRANDKNVDDGEQNEN